MTAEPFHVEITGKRRDTKTVMRRLEGGDWKSASNGNSLVAYPTSRAVLRGGGHGDVFPLTRQAATARKVAEKSLMQQGFRAIVLDHVHSFPPRQTQLVQQTDKLAALICARLRNETRLGTSGVN